MQPRNAQLIWPNGKPRSETFDDIYFNEHDNTAETEHVFIKGNNLPARLDTGLFKHHFLSVGETGFGTGTNLFCLLALIDRCHKQATQRLYFLSTELFPLTHADLEHALTSFPAFAAYTQQLLDQYPPAIKGMHRFILNNGRCYLTLCLGDATQSFEQLSPQHNRVDAWFLDGFAPAKNPAMWSPDLFAAISRLSHTNEELALATHFSTFTIAGTVRRGLQQEGFLVERATGHGTKRDMQKGYFVGHSTLPFNTEHPWVNDVPQPTPKPPRLPTPWFTLPSPAKAPEHVVIIGAGLAGCTTAEALARRGVRVTLLEQGDEICQQASGNRQGALYAKLPVDPTLSGELHLTGLEYTLRLLKIHRLLDGKRADQCGLLQLATSEKEAQRQQQLLANNALSQAVVKAVTAEEASRIANTAIPHSGLFFPRAGWVYPKALCEALIDHPLITLTTHAKVTELNLRPCPTGTTTDAQRWQIISHQGELTADAVVVANAHDAKTLTPLSQLPLKPIRGQVSSAPVAPQASDNDQETTSDTKHSLNTIICGDGYCCPTVENNLYFGATFDLHKVTDEVRPEDHDYNLNTLGKMAPKLADSLPPTNQWHAKVGFRCATPDYMPIVGPAPDFDAYVSRYNKLRNDRKWPFEESPAPLQPSLYLSMGHGSKGLITAPLCAEYLACLITGEPLPIHKPMSDALHPARFIIKDLIRNKIGR